jgi:rod shape-determining protein MreD
MKVKQAEPVHGIGPKLVPVAVTLILTILSVVPLAIPGYAAVTPNFVLMSVYHWTIYRPEHMPYLAVFLIGLFFDLLTGSPGSIIGLTPLVLLIMRSVVLDRRRDFTGRNFPLVWWGFAITVALVNLAFWTAGSALNGTMLEPRSFAFQAVLTVAFFPVLTLLLARIQRATASIV